MSEVQAVTSDITFGEMSMSFIFYGLNGNAWMSLNFDLDRAPWKCANDVFLTFLRFAKDSQVR
jgi:hypothetical protein